MTCVCVSVVCAHPAVYCHRKSACCRICRVCRCSSLLFSELPRERCSPGLCACSRAVSPPHTHIAGYAQACIPKCYLHSGRCTGRKLFSADKQIECVLVTRYAPFSKMLFGCNHSVLC